MFPQIAKKKKRDFQVKNEVLRQWEEASKQLDIRSKLAIKKISNHLLHDFSKVVRIKSIPQFYANYFLSHIYKQPPEQQTEYFSQQIENILTHRSHFHKINSILKEREETIRKIKDSLLLVEGFMLMSQGKNVPLQTKGSIQELVKDCQSLEQLKELQKNKVEELAKNILCCRDNTVNLVRQILSWRRDLQNSYTNEVSANKKLKIIYPHQAMNCLLLSLYDTQFLKSSVLKNEINFSKDQNDPFLIKITKAKKGGPVQNYFFDIIKTDNTDYRNYVCLLQSEMPKDEVEQLRQKEIQEMERIKLKQQKEQKAKEDKMKENLQKQRELKLQKEGEKKVRAESYNSLRNFRTKKQQHSSAIQRSSSIKSSLGERTKRKVIDIDKLIKAKTNLNKEKQQVNKQQVKIIGVYKKVSKINKNESGIFKQQAEQIQQEKRAWQKQMKEEKYQKQKIQRLLKQTQKKALIETKQFQEKLKRYQQEVANLKSKIDQDKYPKRNLKSNEKSRSPSINKKSVTNVYTSNVKQANKVSNIQLLQSKLQEESKVRRNLEQQIKELGNEKLKLQKIVEKSNNKASKQNETYVRKIQKYQEVINQLKSQSDLNKSILKNLQSSKIAQEKKASESMRMYTLKEKEQELKKKVEQKIEMRENKKKLKQAKMQQKSKSKKDTQELDISLLKSQKSAVNRSKYGLQIIKTKQTIEIVFESKGKRKQKPLLVIPSKELIQAESKLARLQKQRQILQRKLQITELGKEDKNKILESKIQEKEQKVDYYKTQARKEKQRSALIQENLKRVRKSITNQYELKLNKERMKFQREREQLLLEIQKQKIQKRNKDKYLQHQMKLLKQMEKNQNQLINMLEREKRQKQAKERVLAQQLEEKQQLRNLIQIEEIKKKIEREVRRQLLQSDDSEEEEFGLNDRKMEIQMEIQNLRANRDQQINELDEQNEKLKQLITRIKGEENKLLQVIKENIQINTQSEEQQQTLENKEQNQISSKITKEEKQAQNNQQLVKQLQNKSLIQLKTEQKMRQSYNQIAGSFVYKQKQKIENLVQFYLRSPHQYPGQKDVTLKKDQKAEMVKSIQKNTKLVQQFQDELFSLRDLPSFVPSLQNDTINNHLLNLREAYHQYQADSLRRELFPPLQEEVYDQKQLSFQSEQMPILSLNDEVQAHKNKYLPKKNESKKNFLAINRVRLMILEQDKKKRQRQMVEQESKKKMARQHFEQNRKKREQNIKRKKEIQEMQRAKKRQQTQKAKENSKNKQKIKQQTKPKHESKNPMNSLGETKKEKTVSNQKSDRSRNNSRSNDRKKLIKKKNNSEKQISDSQSQKQKRLGNEMQKQTFNVQKEGRKKHTEEVEVIKQQQIEQSIDNKLAVEQEKAERELLKQQIKSLQSEIREYINQEQQFQVYQDFIKQEQVLNYIDKIMSLSTPEMVNLNSNNTLKKDIEQYCTFTALVAKNQKNIEIGIGLFHKQYEQGEYICDYILAHQMQNFLNLIFNFSRFIYGNDSAAHKIEYLFDLSCIEDQTTLLHFHQFQKKCKRLGQVYLKAKNSKQRKYVLKRALFSEKQDLKIAKDYGIKINLKLMRYNSLMREVDKGYRNDANINYSSVNMLFAYYLSRQSQELVAFRAKAENQLNYREVLVTALLFQKKQLQLKNISINTLANKLLIKQKKKIQNTFDTTEASELIKSQLLLEQKLSMEIKRCVLQVGLQQINYLIAKPSEAVTRIQSSNSSETGVFLNVFPKYKMLIIQAEEFITMSSLNPHLTAFFYVKHFIKNIVDVKKQTYERIYLPQVYEDTTYHLKDISTKIEGTTLFEQNMKMGWKQSLGNSIMFVPSHRDLVIQKPFIMAILSGVVQRAVQGSPIFVKLIT